MQQLKGGSVIKGIGRPELMLSQNVASVVFQSRVPVITGSAAMGEVPPEGKHWEIMDSLNDLGWEGL